MNPTIRKTISKLLAGTLSVTLLAASVSAATWYVEDGDITVNASDSGQSVTQKGQTHQETTDTVITNRNTKAASSSSIIIQSTGNAQAQVTLQDVNLNKDASSTGAAVEISGSSNAQIDLQGNNQISTANGQAAVHVSDGDLTITSQSGGILNATAASFDSDRLDDVYNYESAAAIGSNDQEDMSGNITVEGNAQVKAEVIDGTPEGSKEFSIPDAAGIGSGNEGDMSGKIHIGGNAKVNATAQYEGSGIGSGNEGDMSGKIHIDGNAEVDAASQDDGSGIGTGYDGNMSGQIIIDGSAKVTASSKLDGAGVGSGQSGSVTETGTITIGGNAEVTATTKDDGVGIGAGHRADMNGNITIGGNAKVTAASESEGAGIGAGEEGDLYGKIHITDHADVTAKANKVNPAIGANCLQAGSMILIDGNARVTASARNASAIGAGEDDSMDKGALIRIGDHANVTAVGGEYAAAIGTISAENSFLGTIEILDTANIVTGVQSQDGALIKRVPGIIGGGSEASISQEQLNELNDYGSIVLSNGAVINGLLCSSYRNISKWVRVPTEKNGQPRDLTFIPYVVTKVVTNQPEQSQGMLLYWVTAEGKPLAAESLKESGILTVTVPEKDAVLNLSGGGLELLKAMGIHTLVFKTADHSSTVKLQDLIALGAASLQLKHEGGQASLLADGKEVKDLLS